MLAYPTQSDNIKTVVQTQFGGFNRRDAACDGEIHDLLNMTSDSYPILASREARSKYEDADLVKEHFETHTECWYDQEENQDERIDTFSPELLGVYDVGDRAYFIYSAINEASTMGSGAPLFWGVYVACVVRDEDGENPQVISADLLDGEGLTDHRIERVSAVAFNSSLVVTFNSEGLGLNIDYNYMFSVSLSVTRTVTNEEAGLYEDSYALKRKKINFEYSGTEKNPKKMAIWHDTKSTTTYIQVELQNENDYSNFCVGDVLTVTDSAGKQFDIKVLAVTTGNDEYDYPAVLIKTHYKVDIKTTMLAMDVFTIIDMGTEYRSGKIERRIPILTHITANNDRIWGAYGNEIFCCASNNPHVWYDYDTSTVARAFWAPIPTVKEFTGIASYFGAVFFFTREDVYRMYGATPDAFVIRSLATLGCEDARSFGIAAQALYYNSTQGVVRFDGESATLISYPFGKEKPKGVIGIGHANKYYMADGEHLYVYNTQYGVWHKEDGKDIVGLLELDGRLILFLSDGTAKYHAYIKDFDKFEHEEYEDIKSEVVFADICEGSPWYMSAGEITLRLWTGSGVVKIFICYDDENNGIDTWEQIHTTYTRGKHSETVRFTPRRRCDHYKLKFEATGEWKLYSMVRTYTVGSNVKYGG